MTKKARRRYYIHWRMKNKFSLPVDAYKRELRMSQEKIDQQPAIVQKYLKELINTYQYNIQLQIL